jgi:hypothetical protein
MAGRKAPLGKLIRDPAFALTDDVRAFLGDLAEGRVRRQRGARPMYDGAAERKIYEEVMTAWDEAAKVGTRDDRSNTGPRDAAIAKVAAARGIEHGAVRGLMDRLSADRYGRELWEKWLRPR